MVLYSLHFSPTTIIIFVIVESIEHFWYPLPVLNPKQPRNKDQQHHNNKLIYICATFFDRLRNMHAVWFFVRCVKRIDKLVYIVCELSIPGIGGDSFLIIILIRKLH